MVDASVEPGLILHKLDLLGLIPQLLHIKALADQKVSHRFCLPLLEDAGEVFFLPVGVQVTLLILPFLPIIHRTADLSALLLPLAAALLQKHVEVQIQIHQSPIMLHF